MTITYTKAFGNDRAEFVIDEKDEKKAFEMLAFLSTPDYCWLDGFEDAKVRWECRRAKGKEGTDKAGQTFMYIERKARSKDGKWATSQMGEYQDGGFYWKRWEVYEPKSDHGGSGETPF
jgi:hypothetical protein